MHESGDAVAGHGAQGAGGGDGHDAGQGVLRECGTDATSAAKMGTLRSFVNPSFDLKGFTQAVASVFGTRIRRQMKNPTSAIPPASRKTH